VEQAFVTSLIKSDGSILPFFERPISAILAACTIAAFMWPLFVWIRRKLSPSKLAADGSQA
jgi:putative tricarboxylic transport membrane protein